MSESAPTLRREAPTRGADTMMRGAVGFALATLIVLVIRHAWVTEDAFITLRTVDNFVRGRGLTWNPDERVQAFTHPLFMFALSSLSAITREPYLTTLALCVGCSLGAGYLLGFRIARSAAAGVAVVGTLCFCRFFIDFSASGLENSLTHLLLAVFVYLLVDWPVSRGSVFWLAFVGCLLSLN